MWSTIGLIKGILVLIRTQILYCLVLARYDALNLPAKLRGMIIIEVASYPGPAFIPASLVRVFVIRCAAFFPDALHSLIIEFHPVPPFVECDQVYNRQSTVASQK